MARHDRQKDYHIVKHHIIPRSRGGSSAKENLAFIRYKQHDIYHQLFRNKTPEEILEYLVNYFWKGNWEIISKTMEGGENGAVPASMAAARVRGAR